MAGPSLPGHAAALAPCSWGGSTAIGSASPENRRRRGRHGEGPPGHRDLTIGATTQARTAAEAQSALAEKIARVLQRAKELTISDKDTKSAGYTISPQYQSGPDKTPTIVGYQATQSVTFTLRDVQAVGKALDAFVQGDAATNVQIRFALDDPKPKQGEALKLAIADARAKAKVIADAAGVRLGRVLAVSESATSPGPPFADSARQGLPSAAGATTVPVGELDVVVRVQVRFAIEQ
ncbi:MAG: SIMPL domain-containing protein [Candidatus Dormibacteraceae bacterium]